jgi:hypothetical protein
MIFPKYLKVNFAPKLWLCISAFNNNKKAKFFGFVAKSFARLQNFHLFTKAVDNFVDKPFIKLLSHRFY